MAIHIPTPGELEQEPFDREVDELIEKCVTRLREGGDALWLFDRYRYSVLAEVIEQFKLKGWTVTYHRDDSGDCDCSIDRIEFEAA
jgi:hypothetical protein